MSEPKLPYLYFSTDIEATGPTPGKYSMVSLGTCIIGDTSKTFYRELKPISRAYIFEAIKVAARGLLCLKDLKHLPEYNPDNKAFNPEKVLDVLEERGEDPKKAMQEYALWVEANAQGYKPVEVAIPIKFDGMFTAWYLDNFNDGENPFGYWGEDMSSMYRGLMRRKAANTKQLGVREGELPHNALEDALIQAKEAQLIFEKMN